MEQSLKSTAQHIGMKEGKRISSDIAMLVIITSMSMLFATLLLGYSVYRVSSSTWPPAGFDRISLLIPTLSACIILFSSLFYYFYEKNYDQRYFFLSFLFGIFFVRTQFYLWESLKSHELYSHSGIFGSMIYGFTWIHMGHIALAFLLLVYLTPIVWKNQLNDEIKQRIKNIGKFWHFLGVIWVIMYLALFVL
ncbi:cytochrome c oxidase subunit 3 [bacterium]|nr:cytochrome c oxidase subunit 3 [bacterium]